MATQLHFTYKKKEYTLEFTRKTVSVMERQGFVASQAVDRPMTMLPVMFAGAFMAHHPSVKRDLIDEIYEHMTNKEALIEKLGEMYNEPIAALMDEPDEGAEGNVSWTAN